METAFFARHGGVEVGRLLLDRVVDLIEEGVDEVTRTAHLPESSLAALKVGETRRVVCTTPSCLRRAGRPKAPGDLVRHRAVVFTVLAADNAWTFAGKPVPVQIVYPHTRFLSPNVRAFVDSALPRLRGRADPGKA